MNAILPSALLNPVAEIAFGEAIPPAMAVVLPSDMAASSVGQPFNFTVLNVVPAAPAEPSDVELVVLEGQDSPPEAADSVVLDAAAPLEVLQQLLEGLLTANVVPGLQVATPLSPGNGNPSSHTAVTGGAPLMGTNSPGTASLGQRTEVFISVPASQPQIVPLKRGESLVQAVALEASGRVTDILAQQAPLARELVAGTGNTAPPVKLNIAEPHWAQQLNLALGERLQLQMKDQIQHATIRLDPPEMGKIDISMHAENGRLQVTISASQSEVYRALQQTSNDLRQSLTGQNFMQVNVQIAPDAGQRERDEHRPATPQPAGPAVLVAAGIEAENPARREDASIILTI